MHHSGATSGFNSTPACLWFLLSTTRTRTHTHAQAGTSLQQQFHRLLRSLVRGSIMAERRGKWDQAEDDLPVYLARPGTADQVPRQKHGGLFCSVEGAFERKTIDFDALSVGQRGKRESGQEARSPQSDRRSPDVQSPSAGTESTQVEIKTSGGKEVLQNLGDEKVKRLGSKFYLRDSRLLLHV